MLSDLKLSARATWILPVLWWGAVPVGGCSSDRPSAPADLTAASGRDSGLGDARSAADQSASADGPAGPLGDLRAMAPPDLRAMTPPDLRQRQPTDLAGPPDLSTYVLNVRINADDQCGFVVDPPSYGVPAGGTFYVNWINLAASAVSVDIAKIDMFNQVPIILGLPPGQSYLDNIRAWCGINTTPFYFRISSCTPSGYQMQINCDE